ncbi:hypothetical protein LV89_04512 [Arcicella aurantiaca]|uniref:Uncharacterized protein n=1 Tax=Arcicella aurantiaca TaxID=591202 RepID=A0A316DFS2_9BACT|nr:hypothetical protein [Arcicella aurantiaca]PWK17061.1 hypothetical protein LV89_04512 [Arcicella aurantiaca]
MAQKSQKCKNCGRVTVHQEFDDKALSTAKIVGGYLLTGGLSMLLTGVRKGKNYYCCICGTVN